MEPAVTVALAWLVFAATHLGLATAGVRSRLVARFGEPGFTYLYSAVAAVVFAVLVSRYASVRFDGLPGPALGRVAGVREALIALVVAGVVLMTATFARYDETPYNGVEERRFGPPRGLERITRHPFFAGLVVFSLAHALLATQLVGSVFQLGSAVVAAVGCWHQDRKLAARFGAPFEAYLRATSAVPFVAIAAGRQRLAWDELPWRAIAAGLALAFALRAVHASIFAWGGVPFVAGVLGTVAAIGAATYRREVQRRRERLAQRPSERPPASAA